MSYTENTKPEDEDRQILHTATFKHYLHVVAK